MKACVITTGCLFAQLALAQVAGLTAALDIGANPKCEMLSDFPWHFEHDNSAHVTLSTHAKYIAIPSSC